MKEMWEQRFSNKEYVYGKEPNDFLKEEIDKLNPGKALFIGEGEGRNAVYASSTGWNVLATDWSENARSKALKLASENKVKIEYTLSDFESLEIKNNSFDLIVLIFIHVEAEQRQKLHSKVVSGLKPGGYVILELYDIDQLKYNSGGPKTTDLLYTLEDIYTDFNQLDIIKFSKEIINLNEGVLHQGKASVIKYIGKSMSEIYHNS